MYREQVFPVELKEMSEEAFPLAYTVHMEDRFARGKGRNIHIPFRADGDMLFCEYRMMKDARKPVEEATNEMVAYFVGRQVLNSAEEDYILADIRDVEESVRLFNGHLWYQTDEPVYVRETTQFATFDDLPLFRISNKDMGECGELETTIYGTGIYRADERDSVIHQGNDYLAAKKASLSPEEYKELEEYISAWQESDYIEIGDVFVTHLDDEATRRRNRRLDDVHMFLKEDVFSSFYLPSAVDDDAGILADLRDALVKKVYGEGGAEIEEASIGRKEFYNAFFEVLRELVLSLREHGAAAGSAAGD